MSGDQGGFGPSDDDDIWSEPVDALPVPEADRRTGPTRPPRRGAPRRPPRRGQEAGDPRDRAGRPTGPAPSAIAGPVVDDDFVDLPSEGSVPRWLAVLIVLVLLFGGVFGAVWWWYGRQINPPGSPGESVSVEVPQGSSTSGIGSILESAGVVRNSMVFNFYASRKKAGPFEAGVYKLRKNSDLDLVLTTLAKGPVAGLTDTKTVKVSIPEGLTEQQLIAKVAEQVPRFSADKLRAALDDGKVASKLRPDGQASYEGLLFPATYEVGSTKTEVEFLDQIAEEMQTRLDALDVPAAKARIKTAYGLDLSTYDLLKVASMIQAEAGNPDEAPKIATVIYNRLQQKVALGIDAADQYGAQLAGVPVDFNNTSAPYNTRRKVGLPPTPISAPGDFALAAALTPAQGPWLYYVLTAPNVHTFVTTSAEFDQAKQICVQKGLGCG